MVKGAALTFFLQDIDTSQLETHFSREKKLSAKFS